MGIIVKDAVITDLLEAEFGIFGAGALQLLRKNLVVDARAIYRGNFVFFTVEKPNRNIFNGCQILMGGIAVNPFNSISLPPSHQQKKKKKVWSVQQ